MDPLVFAARCRVATATCIISHGLGDTAHGWADAARMLSARLPHMRFVLPTAPTIPITRFGNEPAPAWFDLIGAAERRDEPCRGLEESVEVIRGLMAAEETEHGIPSDRVALMGFSQGAALSLYSALVGLETTPAAAVAMSGYLPRIDKAMIRNTSVPVLQWHGNADAMVDVRFGEEARRKMEEAGVRVEFNLLPGMGHSVTPEELEASAVWLGQVLP